MFEVTYCGYNIRNKDYDIIDRPNGSSTYLFLYFKSTMNILLEGRKIIAKPGTMILYTPGHRQWYQAHKTFYNSFVHFTDPDDFVSRLRLPLNKLFTIDKTEEVNEIIRHIEQEYQRQDDFWCEHMSANVKLMLINLSREYNKPEITEKVDSYTLEAFFKLRMHILSNLDYEWNADNMAELANMSKTQFYHYYTYIFKQTPKAELIQARMEYSKFLLTNRALPISQIASLIGYTNESHYIRSFKKFHGISPKQYALNIQREMADSAKENNP